MGRASIEIPTLSHANPIPAATRVGPLIESSVIMPYNPGTRDVPGTLEEQIDNLFDHMGRMLDAAGATWGDMAKVTFFTDDPLTTRAALNRQWLDKFPDAESRPSRHTMNSPTIGKADVSCVFTAYVVGGD